MRCKKWGARRLPEYDKLNQRLEIDLQPELDVAALGRAGRATVGYALHRIHRREVSARLDIQIGGLDVVVAVVKGVVELAAELHVESLRQLERLGNHKVDVPVAGA